MNMHEVNLSNVDLNLLKLLNILLKERSVTRAGQKIGLSQPAASRGLARLRRLFDDPLLIRTPEGLELTPKAADLSEPVAKLLEDARLIIAPSVFDPGSTSGKLVIATADHMALLLMPPLIAKLAELAPGLDLEIPPTSGDNVALVFHGDADLAIGVYNTLPARFYQRSLYDEDLVCLVRRNHPVSKQALTLEHYISLKHISVIITGYGNNAVDDALAARGLSRRVAIRLPHFLTAPMLVAESDMILSLPRRLAQRIASSIPVEIMELPLDIKPFRPSIIWHGRQHTNPAHIWLRDLVMQIASDM